MLSDHPFITLSYWFLRKIIGLPLRFFLIRRVIGIKNIPRQGSAIIALNHQSFFDFLCFASISPRNVHFLSAEKFFQHKFWRILMFLTGQIKVERGKHDKHEVFDAVERHVKRGTLIGIFPEGTRSHSRDEMLKAFTGVAQFALKHHIPIIPAGIRGTYEIMSKHDSVPKIQKIVEVEIGEAVLFPEHYNKHLDTSICTYVTEQVIKKIEKHSHKKYNHYELN